MSRPSSEVDGLSETRDLLRRILLEVMSRGRGERSDAVACSEWVAAAQGHAAAAQAALDAGDLATCEAELAEGFAAVAAGEVCILLQELLASDRGRGGPMAEGTYEQSQGSDPVAGVRSRLLELLVELFRRQREAGVGVFDAPCSHWVTEAQQHAAAADAALAAGDLQTCQAEIDLGLAAVAAGEACILLAKHPPL